MVKRFTYFLLLSVASLCPLAALAWGDTGHNVTAEIANRHLTRTTAAVVDSLLSGKTLVYWAKWLDWATYTPEYAYTKTWHYRDVDENHTYFSQPLEPEGDVITASRAQIEILSDSTATPDDKALALKILTHLVGDMHQPLHMGHTGDLGGNTVKIKYRGRENNLHGFFDTTMPDALHKWSYSEWADQLDRLRPEDEILVISGNIDDWGQATVALAAEAYRDFPAGADITNGTMLRWMPEIENQMLFGGLRLAHILNTIFDPEYSLAPSHPF